MTETLDILPGEGETKTVTHTRMRRECSECGEPAHFKHTYLLEGTRSNPASKAYGKDDCFWCEDTCRYGCRNHANGMKMVPDGYVWCGTFPATERFAHLFLYWSKPL